MANSYRNLLSSSPKGWRIRRCGETIKEGDLRPDGPVWIPVGSDLIGEKVLGCCYRKDGTPDFILGKRLRKSSLK